MTVLIAFAHSTSLYAENTLSTSESIINTNLGWRCKSEFLVHKAGTWLGHLDQYWVRDFYKEYDGYAIAVFGDHHDENWVGPILISTVPEYVSFRVTGNGSANNANNIGYNRTYDYLGMTWYINTSYHVRDTTFTTPFTVIDNSINVKAILDLAGVEVYKKNLANATISLSKSSYICDGGKKEPSVTVVLDGKTLSQGTDYTVSYSHNDVPGTAYAIVKGKGLYTGTINKSFKIGLKKPSITTLSSTKYGQAYVDIKKVVGGQKYKYVFTRVSDGQEKTLTTDSGKITMVNLSAGAEYKVKVQASCSYDGTEVKSDYSTEKTVVIHGMITCYINKNPYKYYTTAYSDDFFVNPSKHTSEWRKLSALAAQTTYVGSTKDLLEQCGFAEREKIFTGSGSSSTKKDNDHCTIYTGSRQITDKKRAVAVIINGYSGKAYEWISNFNLGTGKTHAGFNNAAKEVIDVLKNKYGSFKNTVFWITGHSRGAAITNLVAAYLCSKGYEVHAYGFATPNTVDKSLQKGYGTSIRNYVNEGDFVPYVPPSKWDYRKHGTTITFSVSSKVKTKYKEFTGETYKGLSADDRKTLITAFRNAGRSRKQYGSHVINALDSTTNIAFTAKNYCQSGLALVMVKDSSKNVLGTYFMLNASLQPTPKKGNINPLLTLTGLLLVDEKINPKITHAHTMETYLAYVDSLG